MDFMRGAALSEGGKPIIALTSRTAKGIPRIVPMLKPGSGVVTTRAHVHYVVTEYGSAFLFGKNLRERAKALISIAHHGLRDLQDPHKHLSMFSLEVRNNPLRSVSQDPKVLHTNGTDRKALEVWLLQNVEKKKAHKVHPRSPQANPCQSQIQESIP
jgi:acyl-CoA hydrolase